MPKPASWKPSLIAFALALTIGTNSNAQSSGREIINGDRVYIYKESLNPYEQDLGWVIRWQNSSHGELNLLDVSDYPNDSVFNIFIHPLGDGVTIRDGMEVEFTANHLSILPENPARPQSVIAAAFGNGMPLRLRLGFDQTVLHDGDFVYLDDMSSGRALGIVECEPEKNAVLCPQAKYVVMWRIRLASPNPAASPAPPSPPPPIPPPQLNNARPTFRLEDPGSAIIFYLTNNIGRDWGCHIRFSYSYSGGSDTIDQYVVVRPGGSGGRVFTFSGSYPNLTVTSGPSYDCS